MSIETTFSMIKPNAVQKNNIGKILSRFEENNLEIVGARMIHLPKEKAEGFYIEHKERPFFQSLITFMTSGPILILALRGEDAVNKNRTIMGETDPEKANAGTIRKDFGEGIEANAVHGSDSTTSAVRELAYFFDDQELISRK